MRQTSRTVVAPDGPVRPAVWLGALVALGLATAVLFQILRLVGGPEAQPTLSPALEAVGRRPSTSRRRPQGVPRPVQIALDALRVPASTSAALRPEPPPHLSRTLLYVLLTASESPSQRADIIEVLGRSGDPANWGILTEYADRGAFTDDGYAAQRVLIRFYPESWPASASQEYAFLAGDGSEDRWWQSYERIPRHRPERPSYSKQWRGWGNQAWDPGHPRYLPTAPTTDWLAFLDRYADFMSADDAAWQLARAYHFEGAPPARVIETLDWALTLPDGDAAGLIWAGLRHYLIERTDEADLRRLLGRRDLQPMTRYAIRYALGLRHFWRLEFRRADDFWQTLPEIDLGPFRYRDGRPHERRAICQLLAPLERSWQARRGGPGEAPAFLELAQAILRINNALGRDVGLFEPWLLVDTEIDHPPADYLGPHLQRLLSRHVDEQTGHRLEVLERRLGIAQ